MNKLHLLSIVTVLALVNGSVKGIDQERKDITIKCAKVYAGGLATGIISKAINPHSTSLQALSRAGYIVGSPITSTIATGLTCLATGPAAALTAVVPGAKMTFNNKPIVSTIGRLAARSAVIGGLGATTAAMSIPALVGFAAVPYAIQTLKNHKTAQQA